MKQSKKFYMIALKPKGCVPNLPRCVHRTFEEALAEATRLSRREDADYYIYTTTHLVEPVKSPVKLTKLEE